MATLVLGAVGSALGASVGGGILGVSAVTIGGMIGSTVGSMVDSWVVSSFAPGQRIEGARMDSLRVTSATEGVVIPRLYGRMRLGGNIIWATDFREEVNTHRQGGGKGGGPKVTTTEYLYYASFAVALCEGPITGIGRIWADGKPMDLTGVTWRWYPGDEDQQADPFIAAKMGPQATPAYRGTAYVVFEELPLGPYGNRLPQLSFEVFRPLADPDTAEGLVEAVTLIPASGEFAYATGVVRAGEAGSTQALNVNAMAGAADLVVSLDRLEAMVPAVKAVSLVVSWFGDDLRAGNCTIQPRVEVAQKTTTPAWEVNGVTRATAPVVSHDDAGRPVYGGTPADVSVVQAIRELKARGLEVTLYPFLMMDVPPGNALPDPYSDNAAGTGQPAFPWRGRITCSPAAGYAGTVDQTGAAASQVAAFFGNAQPGSFAVAGERVNWTGGADWGFRRMVLHYAHLCAAAAGVDAFLIGSELRGLTQIRDGAASYPAVAALKALAADVRSILGPGTALSYAADWSEYFGHHPQDGSGDVFFHLDPLWADANIDFVGIDNYMPLSDWRDGWAHADALEWPSVYDRAYLQSNIAGGEGFDWFYASDHDRAAQIRTPITDGSAGKPWVFRPKDLRSWWSNPHYDRPGGSEVTESEPNRVPNPTGTGAVTGVPGSLPDNWSQVDGTGLTREVVAAGQGDLDLRFSGVITSGSLGVQIQFGPGGSIPVTLGEVLTFGVDLALIAGSFANVWEVRHSVSERNAGGSSLGFYNGPDLRPAITVTPSRQVFAHEITDPAAVSLLLRIDFRISGVADFTIRIANPSLKRPLTRTAWVPQSKPIRFTELGCPAVDRGTNQPNVFYDPKSSESFFPHFSRGWRDDAIQRAYLEATFLYWREPANNPTSQVYAGPMVDVAHCAAWTWDARPWPFFPQLSEVWSDGANWRLGHWLTGRLGAVSLAALVRHLCLRARLPEAFIDVSGLTGAADGYVITALESPRSSITMLARHFGFDAVESNGVLRFVMRGRAPVAVIAPEDMVAAGQRGGEVFELTRAQETELPQALKWQVARADEDYDTLTVEARRITVDATRIGSDSFAVAVPPEEADRRCRRALMEAWIGRESAAFRLPPSRLALDPADVIRLAHDGRLIDLRLVSIADGEARAIEAIRQDRDAFDLPPGSPRPATLAQPVVFGAPLALILDLPQLSETHTPHQPLVAAHAVPWPGAMAVYRSPEVSGFELLTTFSGRARMGVLTADLYAGPTSRFDHGNAVYLELLAGTLESVADLALFGGANALAVESAPGIWELLQFAKAELIAPNRYRLSRLLRGQRGSDADMAPMVPAGARVVMLDSMLAPLPIGAADLGLPWNWRIGPASNPVSDDSFTALSFAPEGIGLRPFAPVHVEQPWRRARVPGDLILRWTRRDRSLAADSWSAAEVPMSEAAEAWQVEILDGATVKRVLSSSTTSVLYGAVQQGEDWGGPLGPGHSLTVRIAQLGQAFGPGAATITTLWF